MKNRKYFQLTQNEENADLYIFGDIVEEAFLDSEISPNSIIAQLEGLECENLNVYINSYGGSVSAGLSIYNQLKRHRAKVTTYCEGFACSIASVIFMAGDDRVMNSGSVLMIHNPWTVAAGNSKDLRKEADALDKIAQASINIYMEKFNLSEEELKELLDNETWLTPQEAIEFGFATKVITSEVETVSQSVRQSLVNIILSKKEVSEEEKTEENEEIEEVSKEDEEDKNTEEEKTEEVDTEEEDKEDKEENQNKFKKVKHEERLTAFFNVIRKGDR